MGAPKWYAQSVPTTPCNTQQLDTGYCCIAAVLASSFPPEFTFVPHLHGKPYAMRAFAWVGVFIGSNRAYTATLLYVSGSRYYTDIHVHI